MGLKFNPLLQSGFDFTGSGGGGSGVTAISNVGSTPNPQGGSIAGVVLTLQPANGTNPGVLTAGVQTIGGNKTFTGTIAASNFSGSSSGTNTGDVTLGTANGLLLSGQVLSLQLASASQPGALSSADWTTFNNKQGSLGFTPENVANKGAANGYTPLDSSSKIPLNFLPSVVMEYQGSWDPSTNTPTLVDGTGTNGSVYYVTALFAGPVSGLNDPSMVNFQIGDLVIYSDAISAYQLVTPAAGVQSVNGAQGAVIVNAINQLTGDGTTSAASGSQSLVLTISDITVTGKLLTNFVSGPNSPVLATDTILQGLEKLQAQVSASGTGSVTSVALSDASSTPIYGISGSPVTTTGTLTFTLNTQSANVVFAGPSTGSAAQPVFRALVAADLPLISLTSGVSGILPIANGGTNSGTILNNNRIMVTSSGAIIESAALTNGQLLIGATGSAPIPATITPGSGITVTNAANSITIAATNTANPNDIPEAQFTAGDNETSPVDITGLNFPSANVRSFDALISIARNNTYSQFKINGIQKSASWELTQSYLGDDTGIVFSITTVGQIQYTSSSTGFTANIHFRAITTAV